VDFSFAPFIPETIVFGGACILLLVSLIRCPCKRLVTGFGAMLIPIVAFAVMCMQNGGVLIGQAVESVNSGSLLFASDSFALYARGLLLLLSLIVMISAIDMFTEDSKRQGEFLFLMLISLGGLMLMTQASNLMVLYLAIEVSSIPLYMMAGLKVHDIKAKEAVVKYFLLGAFASAMTIYGISLIYTTAHTMTFTQIATSLTGAPIEILGIVLVLAGLFFKIAAFPFHFWAPDVYEGAPPISTAFISVAPKIGVLIALSRFVGFSFITGSGTANLVGWIIMGVSVASMTFGNVTAIWQKEVKRIMAYSSIAQIGYMLMGVVVIAFSTEHAASGAAGILVYVTAYALMNIAAFSVIKVVEARRGGSSLKHFAGLGKTNPALAIAMIVTLVSLLGIPWAAGFFGKLFIFKAAVSANLYWLVIVAVVNSALSAYYYFGIARAMYLDTPSEEITQTETGNPFASFAAGLSAFGTAVLIMVPWITEFIQKASQVF